MMRRQGQRWEDGGNESGMMVVEATLTFTVFLVAVMAVIYLIDIFTVHNRIQYAINSVAHELASYSYLYQALGVRGAENTLREDGAEYTGAIDDTVSQVMDSLNQIQGLREAGQNMDMEQVMGNLDQTADSVEKSVEDIVNLVSDPQSLLTGIIYMGVSRVSYEVKGIAATAAAGALTRKYLEGGQGADACLRSYGVMEGYQGLDFSGSNLFCGTDNRVIDIVVEYDIDLSFLGLVLPADRLHMVQRVSVLAWLDGDGETFGP